MPRGTLAHKTETARAPVAGKHDHTPPERHSKKHPGGYGIAMCHKLPADTFVPLVKAAYRDTTRT